MVAQKTQEIQRRKNSPKEILRTKVMKTLFCSAYLAPVEYYARWVQAEAPLLEVHENYQKQTIRSRTCIGGANGPLTLNIPVEHPGEAIGHQKMNQARTVTEFRWARPTALLPISSTTKTCFATCTSRKSPSACSISTCGHTVWSATYSRSRKTPRPPRATKIRPPIRSTCARLFPRKKKASPNFRPTPRYSTTVSDSNPT